MSITEILYAIIISPLKLIFEVIFYFGYGYTQNSGLTIILMSLAINILVLPLYNRADVIQNEEREMEKKLEKGVKHIKETFKGDEKMMILQTYYNQNHYKPTYAIRGAIPLLLEIPFFMAAYSYLSGLSNLRAVSFGPIADLAQPDGLIQVAGMSINVLPFLMTAINFISTAIYTKGYPLKTKLQLNAMAIFFLVFLYDSPSGLVFYWTLNNLFSLIKTLFSKLKNSKVILLYGCAVIGTYLIVLDIFTGSNRTLMSNIFLISAGICLVLPAILSKTGKSFFKENHQYKPNKRLFIVEGLAATVLTGALIPSAIIKDSPLEFISASYFYHPGNYVLYASCMAAGFFLVWMNVYYFLSKDNIKYYFEKFLFVADIIGLTDYLFFKGNLGTILSSLKYENGLNYSLGFELINIAVCAVLFVLLIILFEKKNKIILQIVLVITVTLGTMSILNVYSINKAVDKYLETAHTDDYSEKAQLSFSSKGQNVVVFMLDRGMGAYIPYIMEEYPELKEKLDGFTYYSNVISYGGATNYGSPSLYGGYEYTTAEMNKRDDVLLKDKQNEALKVMPVNFLNEGYDVTVCDPTYANYQWIPDLSIYDDYPQIHTYNTKGSFSYLTYIDTINSRKRDFFCYAIMRELPAIVQSVVYQDGQYCQTTADTAAGQTVTGLYTASNQDETFLQSYDVLNNLSNITTVYDDNNNYFLMMSNDITHDTSLLQEPYCIPSDSVDNTEYESEHQVRYDGNGNEMILETEAQMAAYQCNVAALFNLADWFETLKENDAYDNTRIILVSDHGYPNRDISSLIYDIDGMEVDAENYFPLLLVKDFNATGWTVSDEFMTNADTSYLAAEGIIDELINPSTGNKMTQDAKAGEQYIITSDDWDTDVNNGTQYFPGDWVSVKDSIWDINNWKRMARNSDNPLE